MKLTIGFATYDDFHGSCFTLESLRLYHMEALRLANAELIVVDQRPESEHGKSTRAVAQACGAKYIPMQQPRGTAAPRQRIFDEAQGDWVLCMDPHVLLAPGALDVLIEYAEQYPDSQDLLSGPIIWDDLVNGATQFNDQWRQEMWGTWGLTWQCPCGKAHVALVDANGQVQYCDPGYPQMPQPFCPRCGKAHPPLAWPGHEMQLTQQGYRSGLHLGEPFEIGAMGLGMFAMRKAAWPGFNSKFRGFGGEEWYIHSKVRQRGGKCLCLPRMKWWHRFGRPDGVPYADVLNVWNKARNYVIGLQELGLDLTPIYDHFVKTGRLQQPDWEDALAGLEWPRNSATPPPPGINAPEWHAAHQAKPGCKAGCGQKLTLEESYERAAKAPSDINEHVPTLRKLAEGCDTVVEFGVRTGVSTIGLLAAQPKRLVSIDINPSPQAEGLKRVAGNTQFEFKLANSLTAEPVECDLLFIDTKHTGAHLLAELQRHAPHCKKKIVMHDTVIFGERGEDGTPGLLHAVRAYLKDHPEWTVYRHDRNNHGLMILTREAGEKKQPPPLWKQGWNVLNAAWRNQANVLKGFGPLAGSEVQEQRLSLCMLCPSRNGEKCGECGCPLDRKTSYPAEFCPLGQWHPVPHQQ